MFAACGFITGILTGNSGNGGYFTDAAVSMLAASGFITGILTGKPRAGGYFTDAAISMFAASGLFTGGLTGKTKGFNRKAISRSIWSVCSRRSSAVSWRTRRVSNPRLAKPGRATYCASTLVGFRRAH